MWCCCAQDKDAKLVDVQLNSAFSPTEQAVVPLEEPPPPVQEPVKIEPPQPEPAAKVEPAKVVVTPGKDFKVTITKPAKDSAIGLELDTVGGVSGMVMSIMDGCIRTYNASAPAGNQVQPGDFIMGVNGSTGNTSTMARLASDNLKLEMQFRRPAEYTVTLEKSAKSSLGLELEYTGIGKSLLISQIAEGLAMEWNRTHSEGKVLETDRIVAVNGFRGEASKLLDMCSKAGKLELRILRVSTI